MVRPTREEVKANMDAAARMAEKPLEDMITSGAIDKKSLTSLAGWIEGHYLAAGYKRLSLIILKAGGMRS